MSDPLATTGPAATITTVAFGDESATTVSMAELSVIDITFNSPVSGGFHAHRWLP
jgi:hypothetical protein